MNLDVLSYEFKKGDPDTKLCQTWSAYYFALKNLKTLESVSVVVLNILATLIFEGLGKFQKFYTKNQQSLAIMGNILWLQYVNFAVVPLITKFNINFPLLNNVYLFAGPYHDFTVEWYKDVGSTLCMSMLINTVSPHISKLAMAFIKGCLLRYRDRSWKGGMQDEEG